MIFFITIFFILFCFAFVSFYFSKGISLKEILVVFVAQLIVVGSSTAIIYNSKTADTQILNGSVVNKKKVYTSCSHSYSCNCSTTKVGKTSTKTCHTCYDHSNDWDWTVYTTVGQMDIQRIDRRGSNEPPRWTDVKIGEPVAIAQGYENYIKAAPGTLFKHQGLSEKYLKFIPKYPDNVYDYYRLNRVIGVNGAGVSNPDLWNFSLSELNAKLGKSKQVNMVIVLAKNLPHDYYYALEESWIGAKKNDVVVVIGVDSANAPQWTQVMTWTTDKIFEIKLRDSIMDMKNIELVSMMSSLEDNVVKYYKRKPMKDFEYLTASIAPSVTEWVVTILISLLLTAWLLFYFHRNDPFETNSFRRSFR